MCGLVGMAGRISAKEEAVFKTLLVLDSIRGPHSTGVAAIGSRGEWDLVKKVGSPWELFDCKAYDKTMAGVNYVLLGHNRYATKGKINNVNAHPFEFQDVVGMHNGTIRGQHRLPDHQKFEVDSENIFHSVQHHGLDETLEVLDGAYALVYWDKRTEELIMLRNKERDLKFCWSKDEKTIFWASEAWMLSVALSRNNIEHGEIHDVTPCNIHRFNIELKWASQPILVDVEPFTEYQPPKVPAVTHSPFGTGSGTTYGKKPESPSTTQQGGLHPNLASLLGKPVLFTVDGVAHSVSKQRYLTGTLEGYTGCEVRVFAEPGGDLWQELYTGYDVTFSGVIKSISRENNRQYCTLDLRTILAVEDEEDEEEIILGFEDKILTEQEFTKKTEAGCAWCSEQPTVEEAGDLHWISDDTHVCKGCQEQDEVKGYLGT